MMRKVLIILTALGWQFAISQVHFRNSDQKIMVTKGTTVSVDTDTAYVISKSRAQLLNERLDELETIRSVNESLRTNNRELTERIKRIEELISKLIGKMEADQAGTALDMNALIGELDSHLGKLKENNDQLATNNSNLEHQIALMDQTIRKLKKDIRGIWWNGITDKLIVGVSCLTVGFLLASL